MLLPFHRGFHVYVGPITSERFRWLLLPPLLFLLAWRSPPPMAVLVERTSRAGPAAEPGRERIIHRKELNLQTGSSSNRSGWSWLRRGITGDLAASRWMMHLPVLSWFWAYVWMLPQIYVKGRGRGKPWGSSDCVDSQNLHEQRWPDLTRFVW